MGDILHHRFSRIVCNQVMYAAGALVLVPSEASLSSELRPGLLRVQDFVQYALSSALAVNDFRQVTG